MNGGTPKNPHLPWKGEGRRAKEGTPSPFPFSFPLLLSPSPFTGGRSRPDKDEWTMALREPHSSFIVHRSSFEESFTDHRSRDRSSFTDHRPRDRSPSLPPPPQLPDGDEPQPVRVGRVGTEASRRGAEVVVEQRGLLGEPGAVGAFAARLTQQAGRGPGVPQRPWL